MFRKLFVAGTATVATLLSTVSANAWLGCGFGGFGFGGCGFGGFGLGFPFFGLGCGFGLGFPFAGFGFPFISPFCW